jgi:unsaturated rhamnogalacturonyl hydrolase
VKHLDANLSKIQRLCGYMMKTREPKMRWMWGEALFGYALSELDAHLGTDAYTPFLTAFCDYYVEHPPQVHCSDTCAPALIVYAMEKKTKNPAYARLVQQSLDYIRHEPRLIGDAVNHLGRNPAARFYPKSIWVDSLMMFSVFPARYAAETGDKELLDYAARQPALYSRYLQDAKTGLWSHSYWVKPGRPHPRKNVYWGRGNGWVICSLPMILDFIGPDHPARPGIIHILRRTAQAVIACQRPDGTFSTVLGTQLYRELSATALIAAGLLRAVHQGYLENAFLDPAIKAFQAVMDAIQETPEGVFLPEISAPTIPLHIFPYLGYKFTPLGKNYSYGVAAAVFAAIEYDRMGNK